MERRLTAIIAADVVGYSRLMRIDEAGTLAALKSIWAEFVSSIRNRVSFARIAQCNLDSL